MATNKKQAAPAVSEIIREQIQLAKTEKELKTLLEKVNDHINQLLVRKKRKIPQGANTNKKNYTFHSTDWGAATAVMFAIAKTSSGTK